MLLTHPAEQILLHSLSFRDVCITGAVSQVAASAAMGTSQHASHGASSLQSTKLAASVDHKLLEAALPLPGPPQWWHRQFQQCACSCMCVWMSFACNHGRLLIVGESQFLALHVVAVIAPSGSPQAIMYARKPWRWTSTQQLLRSWAASPLVLLQAHAASAAYTSKVHTTSQHSDILLYLM